MYRTLISLALLLSVYASFSQSEYRISEQKSTMIIKGTSSLHDWICRVEHISGQVKADVEGGMIKQITSLLLSAKSNSIRSVTEKGEYYEKAMDKNVYKALMSDNHPNITFTLVKVNSLKASGNSILVDASGIISIAGKRKETILSVKATTNTAGIIFEGSLPIKMTDYNVEPPTALFGTIKTGNEVVVDFKMAFLPVK